MNNPFDYEPDAACREAWDDLCESIAKIRKSTALEDQNFIRALDEGKMLGILIAEDNAGYRHVLYAFSGQVGNGGFHYPGFVDPVFDYLEAGSHFILEEAEIIEESKKIAIFEAERVASATINYERAKCEADAILSEAKDSYRLSKMERKKAREERTLSPVELQEMLRRSQFEKAELRRIKRRLSAQLQPYAEELERVRTHLSLLKTNRSRHSETLQAWLFSNFKLLNALGETRSLMEIFAETSLKVPPSGAGECCAPKLLHAAYVRGWQPLSMAEYWYGDTKGGELRRHGQHYPACRGKCLPILRWMLKGLPVNPPLECESWQPTESNPEILYENNWFCVVNKPPGMLSVPGKGHAASVEEWLRKYFGDDKEVKLAHRLDQDTSGLLIATFTSEAFRIMQTLFATRKVKKRYVAILEGEYNCRELPPTGRISLPMSPDWLDRPRQRIDPEEGKDAVTDYEFISSEGGLSRVHFHPLTGRTHQLRVHAASDKGLGMPIMGDRLYGAAYSGNNDTTDGFPADKTPSLPTGRLLLHAEEIEFTFPIDNHTYRFFSPSPF